ncbi:PqqD family protein [Sphingomonas alba]|uniref:PqqD family protein n=1 Tax=Sphingomonas alba TaxID=2908208 RepID=A0ABT0RJR7_9SPHN|nr:PqqD family protein [Sphingomonas alba]MCL6682822.1 PqqD family protein [Sphingomonas alba]
MADIFDEHLVPSTDAVESAVGDETVILHLKSGTYFGLDAVGTRIWAMVKDGVATADIAKCLTEEFDVTQAIAEADARRFIGELKANDILING